MVMKGSLKEYMRRVTEITAARVRRFTEDVPQSDDITMLMIQYNGKQDG